MKSGLSTDDQTTGRGRDNPNRAPPHRRLGGSLRLFGWCFHANLPGCDLAVTHFHGHRDGSRHQKIPSAAELVEVAEELDVLAQQASDVLNPCEHEATLTFAFIDNDGPGVPLTICVGCVQEGAP